MEWLNKYKKIIISFCLSFAILGCSVFSQCSSVFAEAETVVSDVNGDGILTVDEVSPMDFITYGLTACGYYLKNGFENAIELIQEYRDWCALGATGIAGWVDSSGIVTLSDETWDTVRSVANALRGGDGYTSYPAMPRDRMYYYNLLGCNMTDVNLTNFMSLSQRWFGNGVAVRFTDSNGFMFYDPTFNNTDAGRFESYYDDLQTKIIFIKEGYYIFPYEVDFENFTFTRYFSSYNEHYYQRLATSSISLKSDNHRTSYTDGRECLTFAEGFQGLIGLNCVVFDSASSAIAYLRYDRTYFDGSAYGVFPKVDLDMLNSTDWGTVNTGAYDEIYSYLIENNISYVDSQTYIDSFSQEFLDELFTIHDEQEKQTGILEKILALLEKWLPNIGEGGDTNIDVDISTEEDDNKVNDFATNSDGQSNSLNDLNQQTDYEKVDVDSASTEVDENVDLEAVGSYGTLLSSVTSNEYVIYILLATLSIALVSYVLFGKR